MKRIKRRRKLNIVRVIIAVFILLGLGVGIYYAYNRYKDNKRKNAEITLVNTIKSHYSKYATTTKESILYDETGKEIGSINKDITVELKETKIDKNTKYFEIVTIPDTFIEYNNLTEGEPLKEIDTRYKVYIPFNENAKTEEKTTFYLEDGTKYFSLDTPVDLPIIVKNKDNYGVEYLDRLLYLKKDDVKTYEHKNTDKNNSNGVAVLNYHFTYDDASSDEVAKCNEVICASKTQFKSHLDYFKENNILTIKMAELEKYMDKEIQLPKSVLITIDDGSWTKVSISLLTEYKMYATIFLVTSWFDPKTYEKTEYIELHSHTHNLHNGGKCSGGQGSGLKCLPEETILNDLKASREALGGSTAFCYPFYEYNSYSDKLVKEAGFTMAFIGEVTAWYGPYKLAEAGGDKMHIPRFVVVTYTTISEMNRYFNEIK